MRVRVLELLTSFQIGGTERQVANLVRGMDSTRFDLHVGCLRRMGELLREIETLPVPLTEFRIGGKLYGPKTALEALRLARYLRTNKVQIVHTFGLYPNIFAVPVAKMAGVPIVLASIRDQGDILTPLQQRVQRWSCRFADCILVNAQVIRDRLVEQGYDESRIVVIRNGIRLAACNRTQGSAAAREKWGVPRDARLVMVLSRLNPMKGIEYFLNAAAILAKIFPDTHFMVAGDGDARKGLEERAHALGIADRVTFTGFRTDIPDLLAEASVSVLPSLSEGLSNTLLESMAAGIPVVATRVGGNPEVVEDGVSGLLVPTRDPAALAEAIGRLLLDETLARRLGRAGMERVASRVLSGDLGSADRANLPPIAGGLGMRILLIGPVPPPHGGVSVHVAELQRHLMAAGIPCEVLDTRAVRRGLSVWRYAMNDWTLHLHTNGHNIKSWLLALLCGIAGQGAAGCVLTLHSGMAPEYLRSSRWKMWLARAVCALYSRVICVSPAICSALPTDQKEVLPACLPVEQASAAPDERLAEWFEAHQPVLSTALFFRPEYGFETLAAAVERLRTIYPKLGCIVMGGDEPPAAAAASMFLTGDVDHPTCLALMARSDVFVRATLEDGDSISVREALSIGVPVVASEVGTRPEGVVLFRPGDVEDLAAKLDLALGMERRSRVPVRGCLERLLEIYEEAPRKTGRYDAARVGA